MPLIKGSSKKAFEHNVKTEYEEGKPLKQSLAIAYNMKRKNKKMAKGGEVDEDAPNLPGADSAQDSMRKAFKYAGGGRIDGQKGVHEVVPKYNREENRVEHGMSSAGHKVAGAHRDKDKPLLRDYNKMKISAAKQNHEDNLSELRSMPNPKLQGLAEGGQACSACGYSEGGQIANECDEYADEMPNEFDDLVLRDDLEDHYTGENSGDELGNAEEDERREDIVSRIMASRRKKDKNPTPA